MTRYFEILIEKESIPIDLSLEEIKSVPHYELSGYAYDRFVVGFDYVLPLTIKKGNMMDLIEKIIKRHYGESTKIKELEEIKQLEG